MKNNKKYSIFVKEAAKWTRITPLALELPLARRTFQNTLVAGTTRGLSMQLSPADEDFDNVGQYDADRKRLFPKVQA